MFSVQTLRDLTVQFFQRHWPADATGPAPTWQQWEPFLSAPCPNYNRKGCYVLISGDRVVYIGIGMAAGHPGSLYENHGISARLKHVCSVDRGRSGWYKLNTPWANRTIDGAYTLGFEDCLYLALALEHYLITNLRPEYNTSYKPR